MLSQLKILLVEDNEGDSFYICEMLDKAGQDIEVTVCKRLETAIKAAKSSEYDMVLLDLYLPDSRGIDTFYSFRTVLPDLLIVVVTGLNDTELGVKTVKEGAQDFIVKQDMNSSTLIRTLYFAYERYKTLRHKVNSDYSPSILPRPSDEEALDVLKNTAMKLKTLNQVGQGPFSESESKFIPN